MGVAEGHDAVHWPPVQRRPFGQGLLQMPQCWGLVWRSTQRSWQIEKEEGQVQFALMQVSPAPQGFAQSPQWRTFSFGLMQPPKQTLGVAEGQEARHWLFVQNCPLGQALLQAPQ